MIKKKGNNYKELVTLLSEEIPDYPENNLSGLINETLTPLILIIVCFWAIFAHAQQTPSISFSYVPAYGSSENLLGKVINADPKEFTVAVYIEVDGNWWTKPYLDSPKTKINDDGSWACDITTGGIDETATAIAAFLVPSDYEPPLVSGEFQLPKSLEGKAVAKAEVKRSPLARGTVILAPKAANTGLKGYCYGPYRDNENPDMGIFPLSEEIEADFKIIQETNKVIRTYGCAGTLSSIPRLCQEYHIDCYPGAWLGKYKTENEKEISALIRIGLATHQYSDNIGYEEMIESLKFQPVFNPTLNSFGSFLSIRLTNVKALIVGNEVLLRGDLTEGELISYIREVKKAGVAVTTAEIWEVWLKHPRLAEEVDFLTVHIHPYWEGKPIDGAASYVVQCWKNMKKAFPGKRIVIGETGWPSDGKTIGKAVPNPENQARFFKEFSSMAEDEGIEYFYFELFDETWKNNSEGNAGGSWGVYNSRGSIKTGLRDLFSKEISRPARKVTPVEVKAPLIVYKDAGSPENSFQPSGFMGDTDCIKLDEACKDNPRSGDTCTKITYKPSGFFSEGWSGIYWQFPLNNWGDYPGYRASGINKLSFWVRGGEGGERAEFKSGGISSGKVYKDSFGPVSTGAIKLTSEWQKITISLEKKDTTSLIGGFCWVTNRIENSKGCTVYLDDIQFEP
jgi:exo-beta-1,3-glucanase (GH17 family)